MSARFHPGDWTRAMLATAHIHAIAKRVTGVLKRRSIPHTVTGGLAVAAWVCTADPAGERGTRDVNIMVDERNAELAQRTLDKLGLDEAPSPARPLVRWVLAGRHPAAQEVSTSDGVPAPNRPYLVVPLSALVRMKLHDWRDVDRTHVRDLIGVGLVDASWLTQLSPPLAARLKQLLDTPDG